MTFFHYERRDVEVDVIEGDVEKIDPADIQKPDVQRENHHSKLTNPAVKFNAFYRLLHVMNS